MPKSKTLAKDLTAQDIDTMDVDALRRAAKALLRSRDDIKRQSTQRNKALRQQNELRTHVLPQAAALMRMLAERANLAEDARVVKAMKALGDLTWPGLNGEELNGEWAKNTFDIAAETLAPKNDPRSGDAEMVLFSNPSSNVPNGSHTHRSRGTLSRLSSPEHTKPQPSL